MEFHDISSTMSEAVGLHNERRYDEAETLYRKVLMIDPEHPDAWHNIGMIALDKGEAEAAAKLVAKAITFRSNDWVLYRDLGRALRAAGRIDDAILPQLRATKLAPGEADCWARLGMLYFEAGRYADAIGPVKQWVTMDPKSPFALNWLGSVLMRLNDYEGAAASFRAAAENGPDMAAIHTNLATALEVLGRADEAAAARERAAALGAGK